MKVFPCKSFRTLTTHWLAFTWSVITNVIRSSYPEEIVTQNTAAVVQYTPCGCGKALGMAFWEGQSNKE